MACTVCNSGFKRDQFPLMDGCSLEENRDEPCLLDDSDDNTLINPCVDEPKDFFDFNDEWIVCKGNNIRARYTRDICGLNREDLRDERKKWLTLVELAAKSLLAAIKDNQEEKKVELAEKLKLYAGRFANYTARGMK